MKSSTTSVLASGVSLSRRWRTAWSAVVGGGTPEHGHFELLVTREIIGTFSLKEHFASGSPPLRSEDFLPVSTCCVACTSAACITERFAQRTS